MRLHIHKACRPQHDILADHPLNNSAIIDIKYLKALAFIAGFTILFSCRYFPIRPATRNSTSKITVAHTVADNRAIKSTHNIVPIKIR